jgi:hypothetical protein
MNKELFFIAIALMADEFRQPTHRQNLAILDRARFAAWLESLIVKTLPPFYIVSTRS